MSNDKTHAKALLEQEKLMAEEEDLTLIMVSLYLIRRKKSTYQATL